LLAGSAAGAADIFKPWTPLLLTLQVEHGDQRLSEQLFHVVLAVTVTAKLGEEVGFLAEVHQAAFFQLTGFATKRKSRVCSAVLSK